MIRPPKLFLFSVVRRWRWDEEADISLARSVGQGFHQWPLCAADIQVLQHWWVEYVALQRTYRSFPLQVSWFGSSDSSLSSSTSYRILSLAMHCMAASGKVSLSHEEEALYNIFVMKQWGINLCSPMLPSHRSSTPLSPQSSFPREWSGRRERCRPWGWLCSGASQYVLGKWLVLNSLKLECGGFLLSGAQTAS